jgi:hypothetical protein
MPKFQIQTRLANDEWECTEEFPVFYSSYQEAMGELLDFRMDCEHSVASGFMDDFNPEDWRIFEIMENDFSENAIAFLSDAFAMLEGSQEDARVREAMTLLDKALTILEKNNVGQH